MEFMPIFVLIVIVIIAFGVLNAWLTGKRRKELMIWSQPKGLSFTSEKDWGMGQRFPFPCLQQGDGRYAFNIMAGQWRIRPVTAFDYHYETHSTDSKGAMQTQHHQFSTVILESEVPLKPLFMRPEGLLDKVAEFIGFDDIDFESAEFSRKFFVKAEDKRWAYDVIHARTMEFLLSMPKFSVQLAGRYVIAWRNTTFAPAEFEAAAEVLRGILDRLPEYVVKQLKGEA